MVYECQACFTTFKRHDAGKDGYGKPVCPSCGYGELQIVSAKESGSPNGESI